MLSSLSEYQQGVFIISQRRKLDMPYIPRAPSVISVRVTQPDPLAQLARASDQGRPTLSSLNMGVWSAIRKFRVSPVTGAEPNSPEISGWWRSAARLRRG